MTPEQRARQQIDKQLTSCGWAVQDFRQMNIFSGLGVAVREFPLTTGDADYMLYVDGRAIGVIEAKPEGHTLTGVETQSAKYTDGLPPALPFFGYLFRFLTKRPARSRSSRTRSKLTLAAQRSSASESLLLALITGDGRSTARRTDTSVATCRRDPAFLTRVDATGRASIVRCTTARLAHYANLVLFGCCSPSPTIYRGC